VFCFAKLLRPCTNRKTGPTVQGQVSLLLGRGKCSQHLPRPLSCWG
jgi:hypothetical protein